jgi:GT2 family glycosyltransferase
VSHGHGGMVEELVEALTACPEVKQIVVTRNIPERLTLVDDARVLVIENSVDKGFGENHNAAFRCCDQPTFCVLNPDVQLSSNPFPRLLSVLADERVAVVAPIVISPSGRVEDSARHFPTLGSLARKAVWGAEGRHVGTVGPTTFYPEWVAGMFMLFRSQAFRRVGGFDERFFLYYEDVDICVRIWKQGMRVAACAGCTVVHDARRSSRRSLQHLRWHLASMARYLMKHSGRLPRVA